MASAVQQRTEGSASDEVAGIAHARKAKGSHTSFDDVVVALAGALDVPASDLKNEDSIAEHRPPSPKRDEADTHLSKATHSAVEVGDHPSGASPKDRVREQPEGPSASQPCVSLPKTSELDFSGAFVASREAVSPTPQRPDGLSSPPPGPASNPPVRRLKQPLKVQPAPDAVMNRRQARVNTARAAFGRLTSLLRGGASEPDRNVSQHIEVDRRGQSAQMQGPIGGPAPVALSRVSNETQRFHSQPTPQGDRSLVPDSKSHDA